MSSAAQIAANQSNSQSSTGPATASGKAASSQNNFRHGFRSASVTLSEADAEEFKGIFTELSGSFQARYADSPDLHETRYLREMADAELRLRRCRQNMSTAMKFRISTLSETYPSFSRQILEPIAWDMLPSPESNTAVSESSKCSPQTWLRYETKFERQYDRAFKACEQYRQHKLREQQKEREQHREKDKQRENERASARQPKPEPLAPVAENPKLASNVQSTETQGHPATQTARNAPCPCGSNVKYKRCCGKSAPPVLSQAA